MTVIIIGLLLVLTTGTAISGWYEAASAEPNGPLLTAHVVVGTALAFALGSALDAVLP